MQSPESAVRSVLQPGEELLWHGKPVPFKYGMRSPAWFFILFGAVFALAGAGLLLSVFLGTSNVESGSGERVGPVGSALFSLCFLLPGLGIGLIPYFRARIARRVVYAVTDRRLLTLKTGDSATEVKGEWGSLNLDFLECPSRSGVGSVLFAWNHRVQQNDKPTKDGFHAIRDPATVRNLIAEQRYAPGKTLDWAPDGAAGTADSGQLAGLAEVPHAQLPEALRKHIGEAERVYWHGRPREREYVGQTVPMIVLMSVICGAILVWQTGLWNVFAGAAIPLFSRGITFFDVILLPLLVGPVVTAFVLRRAARKSAQASHYAVTDRRALVVDPTARLRRVISLTAADLSKPKAVDKGGWGHVWLGRDQSGGSSAGTAGNFGRTGFVAVDNPAHVLAIAREMPWMKGKG